MENVEAISQPNESVEYFVELVEKRAENSLSRTIVVFNCANIPSREESKPTRRYQFVTGPGYSRAFKPK